MTTIDFFLSILTSLIASTIFIFSLLYFGKPRIKIASKICKKNNKYYFKFINQSRFSAYDILIELNSMEVEIAEGGYLLKHTPINIRANDYKYLPPINKDKKDQKCEYAVQIHTEDDLESILNNINNYIKLEITLVHSLTGLSNIFRQEYNTISCVKEGSFKIGNCTDIV